MPKVKEDLDLVRKTRLLVERLGGIGVAAHYAGMDKTTLWRFLKNGRAIEKNRELLRIALGVQKNEMPGASNEQNAKKSETAAARPLPHDLRRIRAMCQSMMVVIDMYETWAQVVPAHAHPDSKERI
jgi:hypothetical protein